MVTIKNFCGRLPLGIASQAVSGVQTIVSNSSWHAQNTFYLGGVDCVFLITDQFDIVSGVKVTGDDERFRKLVE